MTRESSLQKRRGGDYDVLHDGNPIGRVVKVGRGTWEADAEGVGFLNRFPTRQQAMVFLIRRHMRQADKRFTGAKNVTPR